MESSVRHGSLNRAIALGDDHPKTYFARAKTLLSLGDVPEAVEDYWEAIRLAPGDPIVYANRGWAKFLLEDTQGALEDLGQAIELRPVTEYAMPHAGASN